MPEQTTAKLLTLPELLDTSKKPLAGYLVGVRRQGMAMGEAEEHLDELAQLATTYGIPVVGSEVVVLREPHATYLVGAGKAREIHTACLAADADLVVFDDDLTPSQQRNWEKLTRLAVIDRREVILGIFADRARTKEARLQVELARAEYSLPRLTRAWTHLERQRGGGGLRGGAGEAQLEVDRRIVRARIDRLKADLRHVRRVRATQRKARAGVPVPTAALVGYTNAGKSSILNALTGAEVVEEDRLFATLDPTTRKFELPNGQVMLLSDTVGFIRKLPHDLVEAFKATLEEAQLANLLVHVVDASHPNAMEHRAATEAVLAELNANTKSTILVLNKADRLDEAGRARHAQLGEGYSHVVVTSTATREGLDELAAVLADMAGHDVQRVHLRIPPDRGDILSLLHREGRVESQEFDADIAVVDAVVPRRLGTRLKPFMSAE
jgi:GTP-binding protein HflX